MVKNKWVVVVLFPDQRTFFFFFTEVELELDFGKTPRNRYHVFGTDTTELLYDHWIGCSS
jgi:hypothetical protein